MILDGFFALFFPSVQLAAVGSQNLTWSTTGPYLNLVTQLHLPWWKPAGVISGTPV